MDRLSGKVIGEHGGLWHFTIGQNVRVNGMKHKMFVVQKNLERNEILVVPGRSVITFPALYISKLFNSNHESLFTRTINVCDFNWIWANTLPEGIDTPDGAGVRLSVMHRYRMQPVECSVRR